MNFIAYDDKGNQLELTMFKSGGEGHICHIRGDNTECAKIYKNKPSNEVFRKICAMIDNPPDNIISSQVQHTKEAYVPLAWPTSVLYKDPQKSIFIGFKMPIINEKLFFESHKFYDVEDRVRGFSGRFTWGHLLLTALNLTSTVAAVHDKGHCIGDLRETNVLVASNGLITIIDCDSFEIKDRKSGEIFFCRVGFGEYLPPELMHVNFRKENYRRYYSDLFSLGILIFKILMNGTHPYQAKGSAVNDANTTEEKIKKGFYAYSGNYRDVKPPDHALPYEVIPSSIQQLFNVCFLDGHKDPRKRPTAKEWYNALKDEFGKIKGCSVNPYHRYSGNLYYCPWCRLIKENGSDMFPSIAFTPKPNSNLKQPTATASNQNVTTPPITTVSTQQQENVFHGVVGAIVCGVLGLLVLSYFGFFVGIIIGYHVGKLL